MKKAATEAEKAYMNEVVELGCIVCMEHLNVWSPAEVHHTRDGMGASQRNSHYSILPLCPEHHRNGGPGVSFHKTGRYQWESTFGTEGALKTKVTKRLHETK